MPRKRYTVKTFDSSYGPQCSQEAVTARLAELQDESIFQNVREFEADGTRYRCKFEAPIWFCYVKQGDAFVLEASVSTPSGMFSGCKEILKAIRELDGVSP